MRRIRSVIREFHHSVVLTGIISAPPRDFLSVLERNRMRKERSRKVAQQRVLPLKCITRAHQILLVAFSNIYISSQKDWWSPLKTDRIRAVHIFVSLHAMHNYARDIFNLTGQELRILQQSSELSNRSTDEGESFSS